MEDMEKSLDKITDEQIEQWFGENKQEDDAPEDKIADNVRRARALIIFWHQINTEIVNAREGFNLAKRWEEKELKQRYLEEGRKLFRKISIVEEELRNSLLPLKGISFLAKDELKILPQWVTKVLESEKK